MVFFCRCFSFSFGEEIEYETRTQTKSTSIQTFYTASSNLHGEESGSAPYTIPELAERPSKLRLFTLAELKAATRNFHNSTKIGEGGFGNVYLGVIKSLEHPFDEISVAVKRGNVGLQGHKQWVTEVNVLGVVDHPNLVKLLGYCAEDDERAIHRLLVYEYMPNGSVDDHLWAKSVAPLSWTMRLRVALDTARGLTHLHEEMHHQIIFRDFKPSNILLDSEWNAKLSDFGYARLGPSEGETHVSTAVAGTFGYASPEYTQTGCLTSKNDVWSYGVFLYVLITGRRAVDRRCPKNEQNLVEWVKPYSSHRTKFRLIVDSRIEGHFPLESAKRLAVIANNCLIQSDLRPKMSTVLDMLNLLITEYLLEAIPPSVPILALGGVSDGQKVTEEKQSSTKMKFEGKRKFECLPRICSSKSKRSP